jgi:hypothetical protein
MKALRDAHAGEMATIVGLGPSILKLTAADFPPGPVITINHAILTVRRLQLPNRIYVMQKDGCTPHGGRMGPVVHMPIRHCVCPSARTVKPIEPEELLLSVAESSHCFRLYPRRHIFDVQRDFRLPWNTMSAPVAARIATWMGCSALHMVGHDAFVRGIHGRLSNGRIIGHMGRGYRLAGAQVARYAAAVGLEIDWT